MKLLLTAAVTVITVTANAAPAAGQTVTADNGAVFSISGIQAIDNHWRGGDKPYVIAFVTDEDRQVVLFTFDCEGFYSSSVRMVQSGWRSIPSRSVLARISQIACRTALQPPARDDRPHY
jgi:hypothetical protein